MKPKTVVKSKAKKAVKKNFTVSKVKSIRAIAKETVMQIAEKKNQVYAPASYSSVYSVTDSVNSSKNIYCLSPSSLGIPTGTIQISQGGDESDQRIGNKIMTSRSYLKFIIRANTLYDATANYNPCPMIFEIFIFKLKAGQSDTLTNVNSIVVNNFFENGGNSSGFYGTIADCTRRVNKQLIDLQCRKQLKLGCASYISAFGASSGNSTNQNWNNNDASLFKTLNIDITKYLNKNYQYNDGDDNPTNARRLWLLYACYRNDGTTYQTSSGSSTGPIPAQAMFNLEYNFTDL